MLHTYNMCCAVHTQWTACTGSARFLVNDSTILLKYTAQLDLHETAIDILLHTNEKENTNELYNHKSYHDIRFMA